MWVLAFARDLTGINFFSKGRRAWLATSGFPSKRKRLAGIKFLTKINQKIKEKGLYH